MLTYPELMYQLETLSAYYDNMHLEEAEPTADALWIAIETIQWAEHLTGKVSCLLAEQNFLKIQKEMKEKE